MAPMNKPENITMTNPALDLLLNRCSCHEMTEPGPGPEDLALIFQAAMRVPDFGHLHPYRFLLAQGPGLDRLGQAMQRAAIAASKSDKIIARAPTMPHRAPLVIVVVASPKVDKTVPVFDQQLCAASTVLTMQLAARALGFGGLWRSGWLMYDRGFHRELKLAEEEQIVGFLYLGTAQGEPEETPKPEAPDAYQVWL